MAGGLKPSNNWKKGVPVRSLKESNASVAQTLPKANARISHSIAAFTRLLLGFTKENPVYPMKPNHEELGQLRAPKQSNLLSDHQVFQSQTVPTDGTAEDLAKFKELFLLDLNSSLWNRTMALFIVKHWLYAKSQGAFKRKGIDPTYATVPICIGLVLRWMQGRSQEIRIGRRRPEKLLLRERERKKRQLFTYRKETVDRHLCPEASDLLPSSDCCSDTEWEPDAIQHPTKGLVWRSVQYTSLLHQIDRVSFKYKSETSTLLLASQRFDQCRLEAASVNPAAAVCRGLPSNCYDPLFISALTDEQRDSLDMKAPSSLLASLPSVINELLE
ncbi:uncharacterized protein MELLADRAFT_108320 [Melampsora larici-populina 98AG31]|uniref:Uncharacterized protein n=1 Tax=Melampsora larici-populina (strain 98AG31 / pathotype 3-4-7) TaxID=747676 RepID=F4RSQ1_MELLP|nr:uncharacterized protein MELLADRAFT_108320 [Melampsora larici-populina 98AG31]EGG04642.1 hypothetical protein MELLADRAFT_108320 [Melampsora larici-populina 98AG31]